MSNQQVSKSKVHKFSNATEERLYCRSLHLNVKVTSEGTNLLKTENTKHMSTKQIENKRGRERS